MKNPIRPQVKWLAAIPIVAIWMSVPAVAQFQNPFQAAKDAYNKAKQQLQAQQQSAPTPGTQPANTPGPPPTSIAASGVSAQGAAAPWIPPSDAATTGKVAAPPGPLDPSKLPDVAGIHVGIPTDEVTGLIKKLHPNATFQPEIGFIRGSGIAVADRQQAGTWAQSSAGAMVDNINVDYTWTPNKPTVFMVKRNLPYPQPLVHQTLVDALRQKYGKEIQADGASASIKVVTDDNIAAMWWLFDEQGHPVPRGPVTGHEPYGCIYVQEGQAYNKAVMDYLNHSLPPATFCDSVILLYVQFEPGPVVHSTTTYLVDLALLRRSAVATGDWARAGAEKQHQDEQQKAKQAKPAF
jgi:hypothetical protein